MGFPDEKSGIRITALVVLQTFLVLNLASASGPAPFSNETLRVQAGLESDARSDLENRIIRENSSSTGTGTTSRTPWKTGWLAGALAPLILTVLGMTNAASGQTVVPTPIVPPTTTLEAQAAKPTEVQKPTEPETPQAQAKTPEKEALPQQQPSPSFTKPVKIAQTQFKYFLPFLTGKEPVKVVYVHWDNRGLPEELEQFERENPQKATIVDLRLVDGTARGPTFLGGRAIKTKDGNAAGTVLQATLPRDTFAKVVTPGKEKLFPKGRYYVYGIDSEGNVEDLSHVWDKLPDHLNAKAAKAQKVAEEPPFTKPVKIAETQFKEFLSLPGEEPVKVVYVHWDNLERLPEKLEQFERENPQKATMVDLRLVDGTTARGLTVQNERPLKGKDEKAAGTVLPATLTRGEFANKVVTPGKEGLFPKGLYYVYGIDSEGYVEDLYPHWDRLSAHLNAKADETQKAPEAAAETDSLSKALDQAQAELEQADSLSKALDQAQAELEQAKEEADRVETTANQARVRADELVKIAEEAAADPTQSDAERLEIIEIAQERIKEQVELAEQAERDAQAVAEKAAKISKDILELVVPSKPMPPPAQPPAGVPPTGALPGAASRPAALMNIMNINPLPQGETKQAPDGIPQRVQEVNQTAEYIKDLPGKVKDSADATRAAEAKIGKIAESLRQKVQEATEEPSVPSEEQPTPRVPGVQEIRQTSPWVWAFLVGAGLVTVGAGYYGVRRLQQARQPRQPVDTAPPAPPTTGPTVPGGPASGTGVDTLAPGAGPTDAAPAGAVTPLAVIPTTDDSIAQVILSSAAALTGEPEPAPTGSPSPAPGPSGETAAQDTVAAPTAEPTEQADAAPTGSPSLAPQPVEQDLFDLYGSIFRALETPPDPTAVQGESVSVEVKPDEPLPVQQLQTSEVGEVQTPAPTPLPDREHIGAIPGQPEDVDYTAYTHSAVATTGVPVEVVVPPFQPPAVDSRVQQFVDHPQVGDEKARLLAEWFDELKKQSPDQVSAFIHAGRQGKYRPVADLLGPMQESGIDPQEARTLITPDAVEAVIAARAPAPAVAEQTAAPVEVAPEVPVVPEEAAPPVQPPVADEKVISLLVQLVGEVGPEMARKAALIQANQRQSPEFGLIFWVDVEEAFKTADRIGLVHEAIRSDRVESAIGIFQRNAMAQFVRQTADQYGPSEGYEQIRNTVAWFQNGWSVDQGPVYKQLYVSQVEPTLTQMTEGKIDPKGLTLAIVDQVIEQVERARQEEQRGIQVAQAEEEANRQKKAEDSLVQLLRGVVDRYGLEGGYRNVRDAARSIADQSWPRGPIYKTYLAPILTEARNRGIEDRYFTPSAVDRAYAAVQAEIPVHAGRELGRLKGQLPWKPAAPEVRPVVFQHEAAIFSLALLLLPEEAGLAPHVALVEKRQKETLLAMASHGDFTSKKISAWTENYLVEFDAQKSGDIDVAWGKALELIGKKLGRTVYPLEVDTVATVESTVALFGNQLVRILQAFGFTVLSESISYSTVKALFEAAKAA